MVQAILGHVYKGIDAFKALIQLAKACAAVQLGAMCSAFLCGAQSWDAYAGGMRLASRLGLRTGTSSGLGSNHMVLQRLGAVYDGH